MKIVTRQGGMETRLAEEIDSLPKPMVKISGKTNFRHQLQARDIQRMME